MNARIKRSEPRADGNGQPKAQWAYNVIRDAIITMALEPGTMLSEKETCAKLGISRTPMREAVLRLAQEGLVNVVPSGGTFISKISVRGVIEGQIVRSSLELRMVRLAARTYDPVFEKDFDLLMFLQGDAAKRQDYDEAFSVDNAFHQLISKAAGFPNVWHTIRNATGQLDRVRRRAYPKSGYFDEVVEEHRAIYEAIRTRNEDEAYTLLRQHLDDIEQVLAFVVAEDPGIVVQEENAGILDALLTPRG